MSGPHPKSSSDTFARIEAALGATTHGRAFLREYGQRSRAQGTTLLLDAVARLENRGGRSREDLDRDEVEAMVGQVETALRDTRLAFRGAISAPARDAFDRAPLTTGPVGHETAGAILGATELIQDAAWRMREAGLDGALCDILDDQTAAILSACRRQAVLMDGLSAVERAIDRADAFVAELRSTVTPQPAIHHPLDDADPTGLLDNDVAFGPSDDLAERS